MRQVVRTALPAIASDFLESCRSTQTAWDNVRQRKDFQPVLSALQLMAGKRLHCMYCVDSFGSDVDHFKPKDTYPECTFDWHNLLLACTTCNRLKGIQFPLNDDQQALLIDPSTENPWDFLTYDPDMGNIEAAFDASQNCESEKGLQTVAILGLNRRERLVNVYQKTYQRLVETVQSSSQSSDTDLVNQLINADDHGLLGWCFSPQGKRQAPFDRLTHSHFEIWKQRTA